MRQQAEVLLTEFMDTNRCSMRDYTNVPIQDTGLLESVPLEELKLTHFNDLYDTLIYSNLIHRALTLGPDTDQLIDLGAGSSIPTLMARKKAGLTELKTIAVDLDPEAIEVSRRNAERLGLAASYNFHQGSMSTALPTFPLTPRTLVVSNPPYIPVPKGMKEHRLIPVDGGEDGSLYLEEVLNTCHPHGCTLALLWGSLTSPLRIVPLIEEKYDVLHMEAIRIHFGHYTRLPEIRSHLYQLREEGKVMFEGHDEESEAQIVLGTILRPKPRSL